MVTEEKKETPVPPQAENAGGEPKKTKVGMSAYIAFLVAILFFSGVFMKVNGHAWLGAFDYTTLIGKFGTMTNPAKNTFVGAGGLSARGGFLFALSLAPSIMLALGVLEILSEYGAIRAAHKLLTPLLRPLLDVPGRTGLALITDLQSTDAGAALTKELRDNNQVTKKELIIISSWQYSGAGLISNYFATGAALFSVLMVPVIVPFIVMFVMKFVGAMVCRFALNTIYKGDFKDEQ